MPYERPRPSAALIVAGGLALIAGYFLRRLGTGTAQVGAVYTGWILISAGAICLVWGLWRFLNAVDDIALHRWREITAAKNEEIRKRAEQRGRAVKDHRPTDQV